MDGVGRWPGPSTTPPHTHQCEQVKQPKTGEGKRLSRYLKRGEGHTGGSP